MSFLAVPWSSHQRPPRPNCRPMRGWPWKSAAGRPKPPGRLAPAGGAECMPRSPIMAPGVPVAMGWPPPCCARAGAEKRPDRRHRTATARGAAAGCAAASCEAAGCAAASRAKRPATLRRDVRFWVKRPRMGLN